MILYMMSHRLKGVLHKLNLRQMEGQDLTPQERFKVNINDLSGLVLEIIEECTEKGFTELDPKLVDVGGKILKGVGTVKLIETFIYFSYEFWDSIVEGQESFFINHSSDIFGDLPVGQVSAFKVLYTSVDNSGKPYVCTDDKKEIKEYFVVNLKICLKYLHANPDAVSRIQMKKRTYGEKPKFVLDYKVFAKRHYEILELDLE